MSLGRRQSLEGNGRKASGAISGLVPQRAWVGCLVSGGVSYISGLLKPQARELGFLTPCLPSVSPSKEIWAEYSFLEEEVTCPHHVT